MMRSKLPLFALLVACDWSAADTSVSYAAHSS